MPEPVATHPTTLRAPASRRSPPRRVRRDLLLPLSALVERADGPAFPPTDRLPPAFRHLSSRWAAHDRFVAERLERALSGDVLPVEETLPEDYAQLRGDLARLERDHPGLSRPYVDAFNFLDSALDILRAYLGGQRRPLLPSWAP